MSHRPSDAQKERLARIETAYSWRLLEDEGALGEPERRALEQWLKTDARNEEAYARAGVLEDAFASLSIEQMDPRLAKPTWSERWTALRSDLARGITGWRPGFAVSLAGLAAICALALAPLASRWGGPGDAALPVEYVAEKGTDRLVDLADGSTLIVAAGSAVTVRYTGDRRAVELDQGAVRASVVKDNDRSFEVIAGEVTARALGTVFDVRLNAGVARVSVQEGSVGVTRVVPNTSIATRHTLVANQKLAFVPASAPKVEQMIPSERASPLSRLRYRNAPLAELIADLNRYSAPILEIADPDGVLSQQTVTGTFDTDRVDAVLTQIPRIAPVRLDRVGTERIVIRPIQPPQ